MNIKTMEIMAIAVLKGDFVAARQLADCLQEEYSNGAVEILPIKKITCDRNNLRIAVFVAPELVPDIQIDKARVDESINNWLDGKCNLGLLGINRIELYEMPSSYYQLKKDTDFQK